MLGAGDTTVKEDTEGLSQRAVNVRKEAVDMLLYGLLDAV